MIKYVDGYREFMPDTETPVVEDGIDFHLQHEGTIALLHSRTLQADAWVEEHLPADRMYFGSAVVIEHRYVFDIVVGIMKAGLKVRL